MRKYLSILVRYFQDVYVQRIRSFVWLLTMIIGPLIFLLFWRSAASSNPNVARSINLTELTSYYLLFIVAGAFLISHIETWISENGINRGEISSFLLKPVSFYWYFFMSELPWRLIQGLFGLLLIGVLMVLGNQVKITEDSTKILLSIVIIVLALLLSYTFKMLVAFIAFWTHSIYGFLDVVEVTLSLFGGYVMPIYLYPQLLQKIAFFLPFSYMIYFPVTALQGMYAPSHMIQIIGTQLLWLLALLTIYRFVWKKGLLRFTGAGQ